MKIKCELGAFRQALNFVLPVVVNNDIKAALRTIKIETSEDENFVSLSANNLDFAAKYTIPASVIEAGSALLPKDLMKNAVAISNDAEIDITTEENGKLSIFNKRYRNIPTVESSEFTDIVEHEFESYHEITSPDALKRLIERTYYATDIQNTRYMLGGVLFEFTSGKITTVSTDGRRLATQEEKATDFNGHFSENDTIVPLGPLRIILKQLDKKESCESIKIFSDGKKITFKADDWLVTSRLIEGRFPRWKNIIPETSNRNVATLINGTLLDAVKKARVVIENKANPDVTFSFSHNNLELCANGSETGTAKISVLIDYDGKDTELRLNCRYVADFLSTIDEDAALRCYIAEEESVLFTTTEGELKCVIMPLS